MSTAAQGPWVKYAGDTPPAGPWQKYGSQPAEEEASTPAPLPPDEVPISQKPLVEQTEPMRQRQEFLRSRAPNLTEQGLESANKIAAENAGLAIAGEGTGALVDAAPELLAKVPGVQRGAQWLLDSAEHTPMLAKYSRWIEGAKGPIEAAIKSGTSGALLGGLEGTFEGRPFQRAAEGAGAGAIFGSGLYGLGRVARAMPDFHNMPFAGESEPPITIEKAPLLPAAPEEKITFRTDDNGTKWAKVPGSPAEVSVPKSLKGAEAEAYAREKLDLQQKFAQRRGMDNLGPAIENAAGTPPLKPNIPLREQPFRARPVGADVLVSARPHPAEEVSDLPFRPSAGQTASDVINANTENEATRPLASGVQKSKSIRQIIREGPPQEPVAHRATVTHEGRTFGMEAANGRRMYEATKGDTALAKQVHDLRNIDVRQAFINAGGDMNAVGQEGQRYKVGNSSSRERAQMFDWMLDKGFDPHEIVDLARRR